MSAVVKPGILAVSADQYHADALTDEPTLSARQRAMPGNQLLVGRRPARGRPPRPAIVRFLARVRRDPETDCWLWTGGLDPDGYGALFEGRGPQFEQRAHRFSYKHYIGRVPTGLVLDHLCRVRHCVNPRHLRPVTNEENLSAAIHSKALRTHCGRGHEFTPENTYRSPQGRGRTCRRCHADYEYDRRRRLGLVA